MPRRKDDARRLPYFTADFVMIKPNEAFVIKKPKLSEEKPKLSEDFEMFVHVEIESSVSYDDAVRDGGFSVPMAIKVEAINSYEEAFRRLSNEEEETIEGHFAAAGANVLVEHKESNISITGKTLSCLKPREWLNDEVINLYMTLLKERERREPKKYLKCHFFSTFFFPKLVNSGNEYNYDAVWKWTQKKTLGYYLRDCDKIFVPISMDLHWSLVVINIKEKTFQYLDSLKGNQSNDYIDAVAKYFVDEVKDKNKVNIDVSRWSRECVQDLPLQSNIFDCGMFMLKYMDFYCRGMNLCFRQEDMAYFRLRTAKEILDLKAE